MSSTDVVGTIPANNQFQVGVHSNNWAGDNFDYLRYNQLFQYPYSSYHYTSNRIKLTMSEIDTLRKLAKGNKEAQEILAKFTDYIEVTVDFK